MAVRFPQDLSPGRAIPFFGTRFSSSPKGKDFSSTAYPGLRGMSPEAGKGKTIMSIWYTTPGIEDLNGISENTLVRHLGIAFSAVGTDYIAATMPVDRRTHQPMGILHGGASVVLAETLASVGAYLCVDPSKNYCVGLEINANHIRPVKSGLVTGAAKPVHLGKSTQIWEVRIRDEKERLNCISRVTMAVLSHPV